MAGASAATSSACPPRWRRSPRAQAGLEVLGISLVTNLAAGVSGEPLDHAEVVGRRQGRRAAGGRHARAGRRRRSEGRRHDGAGRGRRAAVGAPAAGGRVAGRRPGPAHPRRDRAAGRRGHRERRQRRALRRPDEPDRIARPATDLADRFAGTLQFGTAGLRGALGAGPEPDEPGRRHPRRRRARRPGCARHVPGTAARRDRLRRPARLRRLRRATPRPCSAAAGATVAVLPRPLPTPRARVRGPAPRRRRRRHGHRSHNPPQDNGYKVYLGATADARSCRRRTPRSPPRSTPSARAGDVPLDRDGWRPSTTAIVEDYLDAAVGVAPGRRPAATCASCYTPLHGVGGATVVDGARRAPGFAAPYVVPSRREPDPDFPTVAFPNPEEPGAIDLALGRRPRAGADLVIANDPDADRCAVAVPDAAGRRRLADAARRRGRRAARRRTCCARGRPGGGVVRQLDRVVVAARRIAAAHGVPHDETLTGFKWIARVPGLRLRLRGGARLLRGDPALVRDKDGITAALARRRARGRAQGRRPDAARPRSTTSPARTACTRPTSCRVRVDGPVA